MNSLDLMFDWLLATTLRASVLAVIILGIQLGLRRWLPAPWRYALWFPMLLVMVLPVLPEVPFGWSAKSSAAVPVSSITSPAFSDAVIPDAEMTAAPAMNQPQAASVNPFAIVWISGACVVLAMGVIGYRKSMRRIERDAVAADETLLRSIHGAAGEVGLRKMPRVIVSPAVGSPAVTGIFRHSLLLPAGFPDGFADSESRLILLHELTHLKRHDLAVNGLACVLQALHWFNPILWFAFARMRADREEACDAQVLSIGKADRRAEYGSALLKLQGGFASHGLSLGFVGIFERSAGMKSRIRGISGHRRGGLGARLSGAGIIALLVAFGATKAQDPAKPKAPTEAQEKAERTPGQIAIDRKLDTIIVPRVDFENTRLEEGIDFIRLRSVELDREEQKPHLKGINFVLLLPPAESNKPFNLDKITFQKRDLTIREFIVEICQLSGMEFRVDDSALTIYPPGGLDTARKAEPKPKPKEVLATADFAFKLIIPRINFEDVTLQEAVDFLNQKAKELTKEGPVFPIVLDPKADPTARVRELRLKNAPLFAALEYVTEASGHTWMPNDKEIRIMGK